VATAEEFADGSIENDLPIKRVSELFNVTHFVVSQVNPHIVSVCV
jgi:TAG lipase/steryl ester hydrolase/phospholipase A2/LPA acyltransferase